MRLSYSLPNLVSTLLLFATGVLAVPQSMTPDHRSPNCDVSRAYSILSKLSTGSAFCSTLLFPHGDGTKTIATTKTVSRKTCSTETKTKTTPYTFTELVSRTLTLPQITFTEYSSSVLVPKSVHGLPLPPLSIHSQLTVLNSSGSLRPVNKRAPQTDDAEPANHPNPNPTPTALSTCHAPTITSACSSLVPKQTTTTTLKSTIYTCTTTTKVTLEQDFTKSIRVLDIFTVSPPPIIILAPSSVVLTTTVPTACAGQTYNSDGYVGDGNLVSPQAYPRFAQTGVECCIFCWETENCIASAFIASGLDCQLLIRANGTGGGTRLCPEGIYDYPFGPGDPDSNIYPGPCGT